ncbi:MAG: G1 family glutamic endopeptidase [Ktedonobacteraceae bacterium]
MFRQNNSRHIRKLAVLVSCVVLLVSMLLSSSSALASPQGSRPASRARASSPLKLVKESNTRDCPALPANFNPATASDQEISHYHLSPRPKSGPARAHWIQVHQHIRRIVCTHFIGQGPAKPSPLENCSPPSGTVCNSAWSGYYAGDGSEPGFNEITGSWTVPEMDGSNSPPDSQYAIRVGLGGVYEPNLWQAGTGWSSSQGYFAWIEGRGSNAFGPVEITSVHHNDSMTVTVSFYSGGTSYEIIDNGTLYGGSAPSGFQSGNLSADWIDERPACHINPLQLYKLADFRYSGWTSAYATPNKSGAGAESIGSFTHTRLWIGNAGSGTTRLAWADRLGSNGSGNDNFLDHWEDLGSSQCG